MRSSSEHVFWADDVTITDVVVPEAVITHAHVTDVYLLALAVHKGGKLATLDGRFPAGAVRGGRQGLEVLAISER